MERSAQTPQGREYSTLSATDQVMLQEDPVASALLQRRGALSAREYLDLQWGLLGQEELASPPEGASPEEVAVWKLLQQGAVSL